MFDVQQKNLSNLKLLFPSNKLISDLKLLNQTGK